MTDEGMGPTSEMVEDLAAAKSQETSLLVEHIRALTVQNIDDKKRMVQYSLLCKQSIDYFENLYRPRIRQADQVTKALRADMQALQSPAVRGREIADRKLSEYDRDQEALAREKALAEAERIRQEDDKRRADLAKLAEEAGEEKLRDEILAAPREDPIVVPEEPEKVQGFSYREDWKFQIVDPNLIPREYLIVDEVKIGKIVRALKQATDIPGVRAYSEKVPIHRT